MIKKNYFQNNQLNKRRQTFHRVEIRSNEHTFKENPPNLQSWGFGRASHYQQNGSNTEGAFIKP